MNDDNLVEQVTTIEGVSKYSKYISNDTTTFKIKCSIRLGGNKVEMEQNVIEIYKRSGQEDGRCLKILIVQVICDRMICSWRNVQQYKNFTEWAAM